MKIVLLQPPIQDFYDTDIRLQPIGLCYLKAAIKKYLPKISVVVKDFHQGWGRKSIPVPKELKYLQNYYKYADRSPFSTFYQYYHFGASFETIVSEVSLENPDFIGISSLFTPYYREVLAVAEKLKKALDVPIVVGGSHVSAVPESILQSPYVDFIVRGEGEKSIVCLLQEWLGQKKYHVVPGLGYKTNEEMLFNEIEDNYDINELMPDLSDLDQQKYLFEKKPLSFVITSRSCPHRCTFCSVHLTFGKRYRRRTISNVIAEIISRYDEGYRVFDFEDDNLTFYVKEMKELCRALITSFPNKDVQFVAMNGISYLSLDKELLLLMKEAGFTHLNLALVTSDITVKETTKRPHTVEKYLEVVKEATLLGFNIVSYQILGLPSETLDSMVQTLTFAAELPVLLGASMFYLTPNSPIAKHFPKASEKDMFLSRLTAMAIETEHSSRNDLYTLFITTRIINFIKGLHFFADVTINDVLNFSYTNSRDQIGVDLLQRLFVENTLYANTKRGVYPLTNFNTSLFWDVWAKIQFISTQQNKKVYTNAPVCIEKISSS